MKSEYQKIIDNNTALSYTIKPLVVWGPITHDADGLACRTIDAIQVDGVWYISSKGDMLSPDDKRLRGTRYGVWGDRVISMNRGSPLGGEVGNMYMAAKLCEAAIRRKLKGGS